MAKNNNDETYMLELADSLWNGYYKARVAESIAPCVKRKKMTVTTAPNAQTGLIGVKESFSDVEALIPFVSTIGNVEVGTTVWVEWTYSASNMIAVSAGSGDTYVVETVENSEGWKNIVTEVQESSGAAGALRLILSNENTTIYTDENGNNGDYTQCVTTAFAYYGTGNVSSYVTYSYSASASITGTWDNESRQYSVSNMTSNSGKVNITATYTNDNGVTLSSTKTFTIKKSKTGASQRVYYIKPSQLVLKAKDTVTQYKYIFTSSVSRYTKVYFEIGGVTYWTSVRYAASAGDYIIFNLSSWKANQQYISTSNSSNYNLYQTSNPSDTTHYQNIDTYLGSSYPHKSIAVIDYASTRTYTPANFVVNTYYKVGATGEQKAYSGRIAIDESQNGSSWSRKYTSSANETGHTYTPSKTALMIRCSMYMPDGTTLLDRQTVSVLTDAALSYSRSMIEQTADSISLTVTQVDQIGDTVSAQTATISEQANKIALVVSETSGTNVVNTASIVTAINKSGSTIRMNADKIDFKTNGFQITNNAGVQTFAVDKSGNVKFGGQLQSATGSLNAPSINAGTLNGSSIKAGTITSSTISSTNINAGNITGSTIYGATVSGSTISGGYVSGSILQGATGTFAGDLTAATTTFNALNVMNGGYMLCHIGADYIGIFSQYGGGGIIIGDTSGYNDIGIYPQSPGRGNIGRGELYFDQGVANHWYEVSTLKTKKNIEDISDSDIGDIDKIRPITYEQVTKDTGERFFGIIAEELEEVCPMLVAHDEGKITGIDYSRLSVVAIYEIQKLRKRVKELEEKAV